MFLHHFATSCPVHHVTYVNVAVWYGRLGLGLGPGFTLRVSRVSKVKFKVSVRVRNMF